MGRAWVDELNPETLWRHFEFKTFHRSLSGHLVALDVDLIEWRWADNALYPVAVIETTAVDTGVEVTNAYLGGIVKRYREGTQGQATVQVARGLGVEAFILLFRRGCAEFWRFNLTRHRGWDRMSRQDVIRWLHDMKPR